MNDAMGCNLARFMNNKVTDMTAASDPGQEDEDNDSSTHFRLSKETVRSLCKELAAELEAERATGLSVERKVLCALRFFATGSFQASVGSEETIRVSQSTVSECVRRVAEAVVNAGARNKWVHFPRTSKEKAAVKEGFLRRGAIPGVIGCVDGSLVAIIAPKGERKAAFMCRKGYYALNCLFICDVEMRILTVDLMRPGSDHDSFVWLTTWLRQRSKQGASRIPVNTSSSLPGDCTAVEDLGGDGCFDGFLQSLRYWRW
ncbi:hypothetical protein HPB49_003063 [Dermacentor silvarum]|uniref:Uncharacterized protein n=1 Tax=Dermacentor silvarum TaxID=543639 RepID=A0ACB8DTI1_DERSI|nr:hypothetical protein HPB49_003063 [Dermacentor silvarum]